LTPLFRLRKGVATLLIGASAIGACGGGAPTVAPSTATGTQAAPSTPSTPPPTTLPGTSEPSAAATAPSSSGSAVDPADDLKIAAPYTFTPLDENMAALFETQMQTSLGAMASVFSFGFRSAVKDGQTDAFVIVMRFPDLPMSPKQLLDQIAGGATTSGGSVEEIKIGGESARLVSTQGQALVISLVGNDVIMTVGTSKKASLDVAEAIAAAN